MSKQENRFWWADTTLCIGTAIMSDRATYNAVLNRLRRNGFHIRQDQKVSTLIRRNYHIGERGDLKVDCRHYPTGAQIGFYQELVTVNPNGGRYDFDKIKKMPYLIRLRFIYEKQCLEHVLTRRGFIDVTKTEPRTALEKVEARRQSLRDFQGQDFYDKPVASYNGTDADGKLLKDGDFRYYYNYDGRLYRGVVYRNINNMWWVVVNRTEVHNIGSFRLFTYDHQKAPYPTRVVENPKARIESKLKTAVAEQDFERAIGLRDALKRLGGTPVL